MQSPKRVLVLMNLATVGRSSMAVVQAVLSACGVQACPLPTTLLSSHLGGFGEVAQLPAAQHGHACLACYQAQGLHFDAIYTGYLLSEAEFALAQEACKAYPNAYLLVDPALGDGGRLYSKTTTASVSAMLSLAAMANCITPNLTESALLLGESPTDACTPQQMQARLALLAANGRDVVITSAPLATGMGIVGQAGQQTFSRASSMVPQSYPGTGDLFTSALCGLLMQGRNLQTAANIAAEFVEAAVSATYHGGGEVRHGVWFEPQLARLLPT